MRVGIIGLAHESNTFIASPTTLADYQQQMLVEGERVREVMAPRPHEIGGYFEALAEAGIDAVPIMAGWANPTGAITADTLDALMAMITRGLKAAGKLDGLLLGPHGAAVSDNERDMDG
jgi:microcystin degradation protein MlrC